jgi:hypothetical protein
MTSQPTGEKKRPKILTVYIITFSLYFVPVILLLLFIVDQLSYQKTEMLFWVLFLLSLFPCGIAGFVLSIIGLIKSFKQKRTLNIIIGFIGVFLGIIVFLGGLLGLGLIYVVLGPK